MSKLCLETKKIRYFYSLFSENLRLTQNLPNEVFLTIYDFKVDIPYKKTLRITLVLEYKKEKRNKKRSLSSLLLAAISWAEKVLFTWDQVEECEFGFVLNHLSFEFW